MGHERKQGEKAGIASDLCDETCILKRHDPPLWLDLGGVGEGGGLSWKGLSW